MMDCDRILPMEEKYKDYITDESRYVGEALSISFPESEEEIKEILAACREMGVGITIQGGKTGIVGGAVPKGGHVMSLSRMNQFVREEKASDGTILLTVQPGMNLIDLKQEITRLSKQSALFWPPAPTETSATVGGIAASNAKGINAYLYGDTRQYIEGVRLLYADGTVETITRGDETLDVQGEERDVLDAVLGTEGILGIFTEITLRLIPKPEQVWGLTFFFPTTEDAAGFAKALNEEAPRSDGADIAAMEYMDRSTIDLIEKHKPMMTKIREVPDVDKRFGALIYMELSGSEEGIEELAMQLMEISEAHNSNSEEAWAVSDERDVERMQAYRHAAAEVCNLEIEAVCQKGEAVTKLSTDMELIDSDFAAAVRTYEADMAKRRLAGCIFGHISGTHLHINLLPQNQDEYKAGCELIRKWAEEAMALNGSLITEHGIGKLKKELLSELLPVDYQEACQELKAQFDPSGVWNQGNIF